MRPVSGLARAAGAYLVHLRDAVVPVTTAGGPTFEAFGLTGRARHMDRRAYFDPQIATHVPEALPSGTSQYPRQP